MPVNRQPFHYPTFCAEMAIRMPCQYGNAKPRKKGELQIMPGGNVSSEDITMALKGEGIQFEELDRGLIKVKIKQS